MTEAIYEPGDAWSTVQTENLGVKVVGALFATLGWFMRELPNPDEGIDAHAELCGGDGRADGRLIGLQIKSGSSYFKRRRGDGWMVDVAGRNVAYWLKYAIPVVLVAYDPDSYRAYWYQIDADSLKLTDKLTRSSGPPAQRAGGPEFVSTVSGRRRPAGIP